jgi:hypothetical protein
MLLDSLHQAGRLARLNAVAIALDNGFLDYLQHFLSRYLVQLSEHGSEELLKLVYVSHRID